LPSTVTGDSTSRTQHYQKSSAPTTHQPIRRTSFQDVTQPDPGSIPLPPSVLAGIRRVETGVVDPKDLFTLRSEATIQREIKEESGQSIYAQFPKDYQALSTVAYAGRTFEARVKYVEPNFVCHRRLYFEEKNSERQAWELGPLQPITSTLYFLKDFTTLPYNFGTRVCDRWECSAGKCLPGDATPYLLYPVEFSVTGALLQAGTMVGLAAVIP
jgi:hypothetical protein